MNIIYAKNAPAAVGPYSQAIVANGFIFLSGQLGLDPLTMQLVPGIQAQTDQIFINIQTVLAACEKTLSNIIKTTIFLQSMDDFAQVNDIYSRYFVTHQPARSCVAVARLPKNALIEVECIAY